ncbi:hypothetical protein PM082_018633 [Marasmius tenuissimus]|nr:hypothetical protein PM082_018633 [Marasmius tenuissimus]
MILHELTSFHDSDSKLEYAACTIAESPRAPRRSELPLLRTHLLRTMDTVYLYLRKGCSHSEHNILNEDILQRLGGTGWNLSFRRPNIHMLSLFAGSTHESYPAAVIWDQESQKTCHSVRPSTDFAQWLYCMGDSVFKLAHRDDAREAKDSTSLTRLGTHQPRVE